MFGFLSLHAIAASRGDGLRPELLEMIAERQALAAGTANIADMERHRASGTVQAGPNPAGSRHGASAENVVVFARPAQFDPREQSQARSRRG